MKQSMTFEQLAEQVNRDAESRHDFYCPTSEMHVMTDSSGSRLSTPTGLFTLKDTAHLHLAELCGIDRRYYTKMRSEAPFLLDRNVNHWLATNAPKQRIVRTLASDARAIVSSRYAMLDNDALLRTVEPVIDELGLTVESCDVSEERLFIKMISPKLTGSVAVGDDVQAGIVIRNSEVRCSAVEVDTFLKRLVCTNGMVVAGNREQSTYRRHVGREWHKGNGKGFAYGSITDNIERDEWERGIWEQLQASLRQSLNSDAFAGLLSRLSMTTHLTARLEPDELVERICREYHLCPSEQAHVLFHLIRDGDLSLWGVANAVTRTAEDLDDYNRATELEEIGGRMVHLTPGRWQRMVSLN